jgi:hypothetical protein
MADSVRVTRGKHKGVAMLRMIHTAGVLTAAPIPVQFAGVSIRGRYLPRAELGLLMSDLAQRYREMPPVTRP